MEKKFAYIEFTFSEETKNRFRNLVNEIVSKNQFYYSDVVSRISGNVTDKLHFTLFYGIEESELQNEDLQNFIERIDIKEVELDEIEIFDGYQGLYKVLTIKIKDSDQKLEKLYKEIMNYKHDLDTTKQKFRPHITLAYVNTEFKLPSNIVLPCKVLQVKEVKLSF